MEVNYPFFIVGVQRSGSTLLRLLLNAHSEVAIPEEASFLKPLLQKKWINKNITGTEKDNIVGFLKNNEQFQLWNFDRTELLNEIEKRESVTIKDIIEIMYQSYCKHEKKLRWGDKSLFFGSMEILYGFFPNAKFIHIVRDGRDVFYSWRKMDSNKSHPSVMALDWRVKIYAIEKSLKKIPKENLYLIRYEDLVNNPEYYLNEICNFLNLKYEDEMINFHLSSKKYIGKHHSSLIFKAVDSSNTNKWKKLLTKQERLKYEVIARKTLKSYNYEVSDKELSVKAYFLAFIDLLIGLPKRVFELIKVRLAFRRAIAKGEATKTIKVGEKPEN